MTAPTHITIGLLSTAATFSTLSVPVHRDLPALGCAILGSLLPDIDTPHSSIGRLLPFVATPIERRWGHRTVTHSFAALMLVAVLTLPLYGHRRACFAAFLIGYTSHLMADCATKSGVPLFYPHPAACVVPASDRYRIRTGSLMGEGIVFLVALGLLAVVMPISRLGGVWRATRYLMATPDAAYTDYMASGSEALLRFEGRWRESRRPVKGEAIVLDAFPGRLLIAYQGRVLAYGEHGDILPDKSRVRETGRRIRMVRVKVRRETYQEALERIPEGAYVSGGLDTNDFFVPGFRGPLPRGRHTCIRIFPKALVFDLAPRSQLALLSPERPARPDSMASLRGEIGNLSRRLKAMRIRRPPAHPDQVLELEEALQSKRQELRRLKDRTVRFTGSLSLRIPSRTEEP